MNNPMYKRILLKLSGEALAGVRGYGIDSTILAQVAQDVKSVHDQCVQVAIVLGGGNIFRGLSGTALGIDRVAGDNAGMLATVINSIVFSEALRNCGVESAVLSAIRIDKAADFYTPQTAVGLMEKGAVVLLAAGTGNPFFTTDTAAALRCAETRCDVFLKATKVDGIYDSDPAKNPDAVKIPTLTHQEALQKNIKVMDSTAFSLCMDNSIPIIVFKLLEPGNLAKCVRGLPVGSIVRKEAPV
jgi:uridylate kinase